MKKYITILLLISTMSIAQPNPNSNGNGNSGNAGNNGQGNPPCKNPNSPNCNPVPISGIWILLVAGVAVGIYYSRQKKVVE